jgi:hypothetical protein
MQKLVRRGDVEGAARVAVELVESAGLGYAMHRLTICGLEDCLGDPEATCAILLSHRSPDLLAKLGPDGLVAAFARALAGTVKCRVGDHLQILRETDEVKAMVEAAGSIALPPEVSVVSRMAGFEGFPPLLPAVFDLIMRSDGEIVHDPIPPEPLIAGLPACCFDHHCQEGRRSAAYFSRAADGVRRFFEAHPVKDRIAVLGDAVFEAEGRLLDVRLTSSDIERLHQHAVGTWVGPQALGPELFEELTQIVRDSLDVLNRSRQRVVTSIDTEAEERASRESLQRLLPLNLLSTTPMTDLRTTGLPTKPIESFRAIPPSRAGSGNKRPEQIATHLPRPSKDTGGAIRCPSLRSSMSDSPTP